MHRIIFRLSVVAAVLWFALGAVQQNVATDVWLILMVGGASAILATGGMLAWALKR